jgi:rare lipoprotein A
MARAPRTRTLLWVTVLALVAGCSLFRRAPVERPGRPVMASWYGPGFHGDSTASGERFNQNDLTAAHRSLPFGTRVRLTNPANGRSVVVRVNDRGPWHRGREIDVSRAAARRLGIENRGTARLLMVVLESERAAAR